MFLGVNGSLGFYLWAVIGLRIIETKIVFHTHQLVDESFEWIVSVQMNK